MGLGIGVLILYSSGQNRRSEWPVLCMLSIAEWTYESIEKILVGSKRVG